MNTKDNAKYTHCNRCNRILRDPKSQAEGYGPICKRKMANAKKYEQLELLPEIVADK